MTKEQALKWAEALESGEYEQCQGEICRGNGTYCCLGVYAKIMYDEMVYPSDKGHMVFEDEGLFVVLNDGKGLSFIKIAEYIRWCVSLSQGDNVEFKDEQ